jgi:putative flippase GtrA
MIIQKTINEAILLFKYLALGGIGALSDFIVYVGLIYLDIQPMASNIGSTLIGILISYLLNSRFTFRQENFKLAQAARFFVVGFVGLGLSTSMLWTLIEFKIFSPINSKIVLMPLIAGFQFLLNRFWTFRYRDFETQVQSLMDKKDSNSDYPDK